MHKGFYLSFNSFLFKESLLISSTRFFLAACTISVTCAPSYSNAAALLHETISPAASSLMHHINTAAPDIDKRSWDFISDITEHAISNLENKDISEKARKENFRTILAANFDMKTIGRFVLGRYWRTTNKTQKEEYLRLFENMIIKVYARRFSDYNGEQIKIISTRKQGKSDILVSSKIVPKSSAAITVDWRVREKNGELKIIDIMVEGVSMALTQRSDFSSVIQRGGGKIDVLLEHLRK